MAVRDEIRKQRQSLRGKGIKAHLSWYWEYEKWPTIAVLVAVGIVGSIIYHYITYKPSAYGIVFLNASMQDYQDDNLSKDFMEYAGIDSDSYDITVDLTESLTPGDISSSEYDMYTVQKLMAWTAANQLDALVLDAWYFDYYAKEGYFTDLREVLDEETLEEHKDQIFYIDNAVLNSEDEETEETESEETDSDSAAENSESTEESGLGYTMSAAEKEARESELLESYTLPDPDTMEDPIPIGIQCNDASYIQENGNYTATACIVGCVSSGEHQETFQLFLEYLFQK